MEPVKAREVVVIVAVAFALTGVCPPVVTTARCIDWGGVEFGGPLQAFQVCSFGLGWGPLIVLWEGLALDLALWGGMATAAWFVWVRRG